MGPCIFPDSRQVSGETESKDARVKAFSLEIRFTEAARDRVGRFLQLLAATLTDESRRGLLGQR